MGTGQIVSIDPRTVKETNRVQVLGSPMFADIDESGALWVTHRQHGTVSRVALDTLEVSTPIPIGSGPFAVKAAFGVIWVTDRPSGKLVRISRTEEVLIMGDKSAPLILDVLTDFGRHAYRSNASTKAPAIARYPAFVGCTWKGPAPWRAISSSPCRPWKAPNTSATGTPKAVATPSTI